MPVLTDIFFDAVFYVYEKEVNGKVGKNVNNTFGINRHNIFPYVLFTIVRYNLPHIFILADVHSYASMSSSENLPLTLQLTQIMYHKSRSFASKLSLF